MSWCKSLICVTKKRHSKVGKSILRQTSGGMNLRGAAAPGVCLWGASNEMYVSEIGLLTKKLAHRKWNKQIWPVGTMEGGQWCWANTCFFFYPPDATQGRLHQLLCSGMQLQGRYQTVPGVVSHSFEMKTSWGRVNRSCQGTRFNLKYLFLPS